MTEKPEAQKYEEVLEPLRGAIRMTEKPEAQKYEEAALVAEKSADAVRTKGWRRGGGFGPKRERCILNHVADEVRHVMLVPDHRYSDIYYIVEEEIARQLDFLDDKGQIIWWNDHDATQPQVEDLLESVAKEFHKKADAL